MNPVLLAFIWLLILMGAGGIIYSTHQIITTLLSSKGKQKSLNGLTIGVSLIGNSNTDPLEGELINALLKRGARVKQFSRATASQILSGEIAYKGDDLILIGTVSNDSIKIGQQSTHTEEFLLWASENYPKAMEDGVFDEETAEWEYSEDGSEIYKNFRNARNQSPFCMEINYQTTTALSFRCFTADGTLAGSGSLSFGSDSQSRTQKWLVNEILNRMHVTVPQSGSSSIREIKFDDGPSIQLLSSNSSIKS